MPSSACFLLHSRGGTTYSRLDPPHQSSNKKISHRLAYKPIFWSHFLNQGSLFLDDPSLCQVYKQQNKTNTTRNQPTPMPQRADGPSVFVHPPSVCECNSVGTVMVKSPGVTAACPSNTTSAVFVMRVKEDTRTHICPHTLKIKY